MNEQEQRIKIAEARGYLRPNFTPSGSCQASAHKKEDGSYWGTVGVPDYLNDLNAMHEAEKILADDPIKYAVFCHKLFTVINPTKNGEGTSEFDKVHATAAQRAEAFLKTLNLWTE